MTSMAELNGAPEGETTEQALERLRAAIEAENISQGEIYELQAMADQDLIPHNDVQLLEWAGVPEAQYNAWQEGRGKIEVDDEGNEIEHDTECDSHAHGPRACACICHEDQRGRGE